jgi:hypothetical protein
MNYGELLSRAWSIIWEHKFLILLGVLVALGSGGGGGLSTGSNYAFNPPGRQAPELPQLPQVPELPQAPVVAGLAIVVIIGLALLALVFWVVASVARGGLIAGVSAADEGQSSSFSQAWNAGWRKGWRLLGIGILPAIPTLLLVITGVLFGLASAGLSAYVGRNAVGVPNAGLGVLVAVLACVLVPLALVLGLLQTFANRACMLEDLGVFASYRRGLSVLVDHLGPALILFLIQVAISVGIAVVGFLPGILLALCCVLWPLLILVQGAISAYFSSLWTLAWRGWTHSG